MRTPQIAMAVKSAGNCGSSKTAGGAAVLAGSMPGKL
jgi:hypothetical protein